jgi:hypothetical protein
MNQFAFVALLLSFTPSVFGSEEGSEDNYKKHWIAHGVCASIAWAILIPLAIGSSMLRKELVKLGFSEGFWFQLHRALNLTAVALTIIAFAIALYVIKAQDGVYHLREDPHFLVGTVIFLAALLQATFALLRPSLPHKLPHNEEKKESVKDVDATETKDVGFMEDVEIKDVENKEESTDKESSEEIAVVVGKKSMLRHYWEVNHRFFGVGLLATAWWQLHSGWILFEEEDFGGKDLGNAFLGVASGIMGFFVIAKVVQKVLEARA